MTPDQTPWSPEEDATLSRGIKNHMLAKEIRPELPGRSLRSMTKKARAKLQALKDLYTPGRVIAKDQRILVEGKP